jgi:hypothetical protein
MLGRHRLGLIQHRKGGRSPPRRRRGSLVVSHGTPLRKFVDGPLELECRRWMHGLARIVAG